MSIAYTLIIWVYSATVLSAAWTLADSTLNSGRSMIGAAVVNNSMHIFDSSSNIEYELDPVAKSITYLGSVSTGADSYIWGQWWTRSGINVYFVNGATPRLLSKFNMLTKQWTNSWSNSFTYDVSYYGCIASSDTDVYLVGGRALGGSSWRYVQILTLSSGSWSTNNPQMKIGRDSHGCLVAGDYLWAFGGHNWIGGTDTFQKTAERLSLKGILSLNQWNYIDSLTDKAQEARAASYGDNVYVIAGWSDNGINGGRLDTVHIYDVADGSAILSPDRLPYAHYASAVMVKDNVIYVFGGYTASGATNQWCYLEITTPEPSAAPTTAEPSSPPSKAPTKYPTEAPLTKAPSNYPSVAPSEMPSQAPSEGPSKNPSQAPSSDPTVAPSVVPSQAPSSNPSQVPSNPPSKSPTAIMSTMNDEKESAPSLFTNTIVLIFIGGVLFPLLLIAIFCIVNHKDAVKRCCRRVVHADIDTDAAALQNALEMNAQLPMDGDMANVDGDAQVHDKEETPEVQGGGEGDKGTVEGVGGGVVIEGAVKTKKTPAPHARKTGEEDVVNESGGTNTGNGDDGATVTGNGPMHTSGNALADV